MVLAVYDFDRFARYYDLDYGDYRDDVTLYCNFAARSGSPILDVACGTGRVLLPLAEAGFEVTGVDVSAAMLAMARDKVAAAGVAARAQIVQADARGFHLPHRFALAFVALNSFMHFVALADQLRVLACIRAHLRPGGLLILDLFNPDPPRLLEGRDVVIHDHTRRDLATGRLVSRFHVSRADLADQRLDLTFIYDELADDGSVRRTLAPFALHYFWRRELELLLDQAGFAVEHLYGSYQLDEYTAESEQLIVVAARRGEGGGHA